MGRVTRCTNCGAENESGAVFCVACGHFLEWTDPQPVRKPPPPAVLHRRPHPSRTGARAGAGTPARAARSGT